MACVVTLRVVDPGSGAATLLERARTLFEDVERACTRFDPQSPLMRANASPESWHDVPPELYQAIGAAAEAYRLTAGRFDPRVLRALQGLGYDRSLPFAGGGVRTADHSAAPAAGTPWAPGLDPERSAVRLGPEPVDLGGIGKGLAVDRAADLLAAAGRAVLVEAGGDCRLVGAGPEDTGWRIGVEDPFGGASPLAVLSLANLGCATSSIRLRQWTAGGRRVHHLIDPRTGQPGGHGLQAVTVAAPATAMAEVWSKVLFLAGSAGVADLARAQGLAALWVTDDGSVGTTRAMDELVVWRGDHDG
jgi:thiamine biosynthesis lipoprotein